MPLQTSSHIASTTINASWSGNEFQKRLKPTRKIYGFLNSEQICTATTRFGDFAERNNRQVAKET
jgi:hypothetical protein